MSRCHFDRHEVVNSAINAFWQSGYHATSMQKLFSATGLKPGSLYMAFGNKSGLFSEALQQYTQNVLITINKILSEAQSIEHGIHTILMGVVEESFQENYRGCFLVNTQLELAANNATLYTLASSHLQSIEKNYFQHFEQKFTSVTAHEYTTSLMFHLCGLRAYGRAEKTRDELESALQLGLPWLPWKKDC